ncbi:hypothetical protein Tco_1218998 [Tanacetum coccineum]
MSALRLVDGAGSGIAPSESMAAPSTYSEGRGACSNNCQTIIKGTSSIRILRRDTPRSCLGVDGSIEMDRRFADSRIKANGAITFNGDVNEMQGYLFVDLEKKIKKH